jgi:hypothetical protein
MLTRTECCATAACERTSAPVAAEPVNDTRSSGCSASSSPCALPHTTDKAPAGSTPASTTSFTICCASHAVAVAGFSTTGTPDSSAGAAFSHRPQAGKLNALMNSARPREGTSTCRLWNVSSRPRRTASPSGRNGRVPSVAASLA